MEFLTDWYAQCKFKGPDDFVFSIRTNSPIDLNRVVERVVKPIAEGLGLPRFSWHDFRHAYTTWGRKAGVEAEVMRDQVGHTSVLMTQDVYSHLDNRDAAAEKIGSYVWPETTNGTPESGTFMEPLAGLIRWQVARKIGRAAEI